MKGLGRLTLCYPSTYIPASQGIGTRKDIEIAFEGLATWLYKAEDRSLARRILAKAELVSEEDGDMLDLHFTFQAMIEVFYKDRDTDSTALAAAIEAYEKQLDFAPKAARAWKSEYPKESLPSHKGYNQLTIICEKQKNYVERIRLCRLASNEGWAGDREGRIARCGKKIAKNKEQ